MFDEMLMNLHAEQAPIGPFDVGGTNYGSGPKAFWPGSGSYSTFGLYSNSNAEVLHVLPTCTHCVSSAAAEHISARVMPHARVRLSRAHPYSCDFELQLHRARCVRR